MLRFLFNLHKYISWIIVCGNTFITFRIFFFKQQVGAEFS